MTPNQSALLVYLATGKTLADYVLKTRTGWKAMPSSDFEYMLTQTPSAFGTYAISDAIDALATNPALVGITDPTQAAQAQGVAVVIRSRLSRYRSVSPADPDWGTMQAMLGSIGVLPADYQTRIDAAFGVFSSQAILDGWTTDPTDADVVTARRAVAIDGFRSAENNEHNAVAAECTRLEQNPNDPIDADLASMRARLGVG